MDNAEIILKKVQENKAILLDVRSPLEYKMGHAEGSQNVPLDKVGTFNTVSNDSEIYLYCASGSRSSSAEGILRQNGFTNLHNIGGLGNWSASGGKVVR